MGNFMSLQVVLGWGNLPCYENSSFSLGFKEENYAELLLLKKALELQDWNLCPYILTDGLGYTLTLQLSPKEIELLQKLLAMDGSTYMTTLGVLIQAIFLVKSGLW